MASAWGLSWGDAWGNAWGASTEEQAAPVVVGGGNGGGGGLGTDWRKRHQKRKLELAALDEEIRRVLSPEQPEKVEAKPKPDISAAIAHVEKLQTRVISLQGKLDAADAEAEARLQQYRAELEAKRVALKRKRNNEAIWLLMAA